MTNLNGVLSESVGAASDGVVREGLWEEVTTEEWSVCGDLGGEGSIEGTAKVPWR